LAATLALAAVAVVVCNAPIFADDTTTCSAVGQSMLTFSEGVNGAVIAAAKATLAASSLPGTTPKRNPAFKVVEEQSVKAASDVSTALSALGPLVDANFGDPAVQKATDAVTLEGRAELQEALSFSRLSLRFEQVLNERRNAERRLALANALRAFGSAMSGSVSNAYGTVNGQPFSATVVTRTPNNYQPIRIPPDATIGQTAEALNQEEARLLFLPYTFNPLVAHWTAACKAAHQLPASPKLSEEISMAKSALAKGVAPDAVLKMFMQRTSLTESEAREALGLPPAPTPTP
jgi:hypothetical protein